MHGLAAARLLVLQRSGPAKRPWHRPLADGTRQNSLSCACRFALCSSAPTFRPPSSTFYFLLSNSALPSVLFRTRAEVTWSVVRSPAGRAGLSRRSLDEGGSLGIGGWSRATRLAPLPLGVERWALSVGRLRRRRSYPLLRSTFRGLPSCTFYFLTRFCPLPRFARWSLGPVVGGNAAVPFANGRGAFAPQKRSAEIIKINL
jgi:hypothetical protein